MPPELRLCSLLSPNCVQQGFFWGGCEGVSVCSVNVKTTSIIKHVSVDAETDFLSATAVTYLSKQTDKLFCLVPR